jgi:hypothetical protein
VPRAVRRALEQERGAVAVIVALFLVGLLVIAALVLDLGTGYDHDLELQGAADAGALAGAQQLIDEANASQAGAVAQSYVAQNVAPGDPGSTVQGGNVAFTNGTPAVGERSVAVDLVESHVPFNFAQIIGASEGSVTAHAKAELMYLTGMPQASPVAIPFLRPPRFVMDVDGHFGDLTDPAIGSDSDTGVYTGSSSTSGGSGLHYIFLGARDENNRDLLAPDLVGSVYVPSSSSTIRSIDVSRSHGSGTESVHVTVESTQPLTNLYVWTFSSSFLGLPIWGSSPFPVTPVGTSGTTYAGTVTVTPGFYLPNWEALVGIATGSASSFGAFPFAQPNLACWGVFAPGGSIEYFDQNHYSGAGSVTGIVKTHAFHLGAGITINTADTVFKNTFGENGWGDMFAGASFTQEVEASVGLIAPGSGWRLRPDTENNGNNSGNADIGEVVPVNGSVRSAAGWGVGLLEALNQGKPVAVALVAPAYTGSQWHQNWWGDIGTWWDFVRQFWPNNNQPPATVPIVGFGALQLTGVSLQGTNALISGTFTRSLAAGAWTDVKPKTGIYVETAVLTE